MNVTALYHASLPGFSQCFRAVLSLAGKRVVYS
jgi:hypothetical protein